VREYCNGSARTLGLVHALYLPDDAAGVIIIATKLYPSHLCFPRSDGASEAPLRDVHLRWQRGEDLLDLPVGRYKNASTPGIKGIDLGHITFIIHSDIVKGIWIKIKPRALIIRTSSRLWRLESAGASVSGGR
jgi:hypothetical protein